MKVNGTAVILRPLQLQTIGVSMKIIRSVSTLVTLVMISLLILFLMISAFPFESTSVSAHGHPHRVI